MDHEVARVASAHVRGEVEHLEGKWTNHNEDWRKLQSVGREGGGGWGEDGTLGQVLVLMKRKCFKHYAKALVID